MTEKERKELHEIVREEVRKALDEEPRPTSYYIPPVYSFIPTTPHPIPGYKYNTRYEDYDTRPTTGSGWTIPITSA